MNKLPNTEKESLHHNLEHMSTMDLISGINGEDEKVASAVQQVLPAVKRLIDNVYERMDRGGRLFYIGAGTSGRLGVLDASECPPTFGVADNLVVGLIAGGDGAIRKAVEFAEDDANQAWKDLNEYTPEPRDSVIGLAASGATPYVLGGINTANEAGLLTGCITCSPDSPIGNSAKFPVEVNVGPEFLTGSTRMKSGTAQKMILNMLSTSLMIKLGNVKGNKMVSMMLSNQKLEKRAQRMLMDELNIDESLAKKLLLEYGSVKSAITSFKK